MTFLESFYLSLVADRDCSAEPYFEINGFQVPFEQSSGPILAGQTWTGWGFPQSVPHQLKIFAGQPDPLLIRELKCVFQIRGGLPHESVFRQITLSSEKGFPIWTDPASGGFAV
ncbi:MAG: hypothetical protein H6510_08615 [Acidobacteria bacterium]|nr:hypothetical protein [Acidobacteriota bacterium]MCB9397864.1 hypothetical protein [Acidobacteriota bacterium]